MNSELNRTIFLSELLHKNDGYEYDGIVLSLSIGNKNFNDVKKKLSDFNIPFTESIQSNITIDLRKSKLGLRIYFDISYFLKDFKLSTLNQDFAILLFDDSYLFYSAQDTSYSTEKSIEKTNLLVENTVSYLNLKEKFSLLADYQNTANNEFVFYTSTKGIYRLSYPNITPNFSVNVKNHIEGLLFKLESPDFKLFFVNELFDFLKDSKEPIVSLIQNIQSIVSSAERNHQLYIKNFSFEEFRNKLQSEKTHYFNSIREILGKVLNQLISIPISLSAVVFTVYKIESVFPLIIILIGYLVYLLYFIKFQGIYFSDIKEIYSDFQKDFNEIKDKSGIPIEEISIEEQKIIRRISNIKTIIIALITSTSILSIILVVFILSKIGVLSISDFFGNLVLFILKLLSNYS